TIELRNFGVFEIKVRKSRKGRNPNKPKNEVVIPERAVVKFRAGKELKKLSNNSTPKKSNNFTQKDDLRFFPNRPFSHFL
ncbi:MAG: HU family DNA-binding protein, partial [Clostridia bacterium]|nr:HU family DNA-binding protein [Clostridia bacterium]